jgi:uncharacterized membrane protein
MSQSHHPAPTSIQQVFPGIEDQLEAVPGFSAASQQVADVIDTTVLDNAPAARHIADALHGSWLGHPLHPALVHIPIGAWALSALFDAFEVATGDHHAGQTADTLITIGAAAAVPTALAGIADYSAMKQDATTLAAAHGTLNSVGLGLYLISATARSFTVRQRTTSRPSPPVCTMAWFRSSWMISGEPPRQPCNDDAAQGGIDQAGRQRTS